MTGWRGGRDLTLVLAPIFVLCWLDLQQVIFRVQLVNRSEPEVGCVRQSTDRQQVRVRMPDPRHLNVQKKIHRGFIILKRIHRRSLRLTE